MFFTLSFTEFKKMMQKGVDKLLQSKEESEMHSMVIIEDSKNQIEYTDDQAKDHIKGN